MLGTGVLILPYRSRLPLAKAIASLQELSAGRFILGVGVGWMDPEFRALGVPRNKRGEIFEDTLSFINECFEKGINKINVITGKGLRSKNLNDPYQSKNLSILKHSVPNFIKGNSQLMSKIINIDFDSVNSPSKGNFDIFLKTIK